MTRSRKKTHRKNPAAAQQTNAAQAPGPAPSGINKVAAPLLLLVMVVLYYWQIVTAQGFLWNDFPEQNFPYRLFAAGSLKQGVFPFWNPYVFSGMPFFADVQAAMLYPLNLLLTLFASPDWLSPFLVECQIIVHILLAGIFMFMLCRDLKRLRSASIVAAITFMFCAFINTHIFHVNLVHTAVWFPLIVMLFRRTIETRKAVYAALCALALANAFLAGYPQLMLHMYYWLAAFFIFGLIVRVRTKKSQARTEGYRAALFAALIFLSLGMSAIQLLPTNDLGKNSARPTLEFKESCEGSLRPYRFITLVIPNFFGRPGDTYWGIAASDIRPGMHTYWETAIYCGILPLILAVLAAIFIRTPFIWFLAGMGILSFLCAMGDSFFLYWIAYHLLPGLNRFRIPGRFAFLFSFSIAILAAYGLQWLIESAHSLSQQIKKRMFKALIVLAALSVLLGFCAIAGAFNGLIAGFLESSGQFGNDPAAIGRFIAQRITPSLAAPCWAFIFFAVASMLLAAGRIMGVLNTRATVFAAVGIVFIDLLVFQYGSGFPFSQQSYSSRGSDPNRVYAKSGVVRQLQQQLEHEFFRINSRSSRPGTTDLGGRHMIFQKNQGSVHKLFLMEGYNPLRLKRQLIDRRKKALDILNVKYAIIVDEQTGRMGFGLNEGYFPRARMVYDYRVIADEETILQAMWNDNFNHAQTVILEQEAGVKKCETCDSVPWKAEITSYNYNEIKIDVTTERDGFLVLSEIHYPCWQASVDGKAATLHRADYALRAIEVPAGSHEVRCYYKSAAFARGAYISIFCLLVTAALCVYSMRAVKKAKATAP
jgi:hypothetical protein